MAIKKAIIAAIRKAMQRAKKIPDRVKRIKVLQRLRAKLKYHQQSRDLKKPSMGSPIANIHEDNRPLGGGFGGEN